MEMLWDKKELVLVVSLKGHMDLLSAQAFESEGLKRVDKLDAPLVVDLDGLEYVSSAGLRALLAVAKKVDAGGNEVRFCHLKGIVADTFRCSGLDTKFPIFASLENAIGEM